MTGQGFDEVEGGRRHAMTIDGGCHCLPITWATQETRYSDVITRRDALTSRARRDALTSRADVTR